MAFKSTLDSIDQHTSINERRIDKDILFLFYAVFFFNVSFHIRCLCCFSFFFLFSKSLGYSLFFIRLIFSLIFCPFSSFGVLLFQTLTISVSFNFADSFFLTSIMVTRPFRYYLRFIFFTYLLLLDLNIVYSFFLMFSSFPLSSLKYIIR